MSGDCCCNGRGCGEAAGVSRRGFLRKVAAGTAALSLAEWAGESAAHAAWLRHRPRTDLSVLARYPVARPRVYAGAHTGHVRMPIGGIGTGTVWLDGDGRLGVWQIFNNYGEERIPDSFFAVRVAAEGGDPAVRVLQTAPEPGFAAFPELEYEGGYPIARLAFRDPALPVEFRLEALNPMIPLDTESSSIPCALFRISATNTGDRRARVSFLGTCQNAVGSQGAGSQIADRRFVGYGGNVNTTYRGTTHTLVAMERHEDPPESGQLHVRDASGQRTAGTELLWLKRLQSAQETAAAGRRDTEVVEELVRLLGEGGGVVIGGVTPDFVAGLEAARQRAASWDQLEVFDDFESGTYEKWTVTGTAFGTEPHTGTSPGQQPVSGFRGKRLVNSFVPNDQPQGEMLSEPFTIRRKFIGFLLGGGSHARQTCMNLLVDGKVVRTARGRDLEELAPVSWDVSQFAGKEARLQIVDHNSGGWGHINIDHIVFSDAAPDLLIRLEGPSAALAELLATHLAGAESATADGAPAKPASPAGQSFAGLPPWPIAGYTRLEAFAPSADGLRVLATAADGAPILLGGTLGKAAVVLSLAEGMPWDWARRAVEHVRGAALEPGEAIVPAAPTFGTMALCVNSASAVACASWEDPEALAAQWRFKDAPAGREHAGPSPVGQTHNVALCVPVMLEPGEEKSATFTLAWHFPNVQRFDHFGNYYTRRFGSARAVAEHVAQNLDALWDRTELYHQTLYQSNLPEEFIDAMSSQSVIFRGPTCWWSEEGYFAGYEGCYGCCPLNCTHVWNYAQSHARLFPAVGRNLRVSDLITYLHPNGETSHRQHAESGGFIDGHCAVIEATLREHQLSPDMAFLRRVWPNLRKAVDWLIEAIDKDHDGVPAGHQYNTYDCAVSGANTFIGSQYLSALAAGERMAEDMGAPAVAAKWRAIRMAGMANQDQRLWDGDWYIQIPETPPAHDYNTGCHSDQLLGQWWAHMLGLGYLFPRDRVRRALQSVMKHNMKDNFVGFTQAPRRYIPDDEGGLLMCTWPKGGRPDPFTIYSDEVWTGIEYSTAGLMIYEGMIDEARRIVRTARSRYDGRLRPELNSGPGGNPFNELECGKFYARAMSSWSLLIASQGLVLDGPAGLIGFKPRWQPEDHRSFYTAPEGWGLFVQKREAESQTSRIDVRHGRLRVRELVVQAPPGAGEMRVDVRAGGRRVRVAASQQGDEVRIRCSDWVAITEGQEIEIRLTW